MLDKYLDTSIEAMLYEIIYPNGRTFDSIGTAYIYLGHVLDSIEICFSDKAHKQFFIKATSLVKAIEGPTLFLVYAISYLFVDRYNHRFGLFPQEFIVSLLNSIKFDPRMLAEVSRDQTECVVNFVCLMFINHHLIYNLLI